LQTGVAELRDEPGRKTAVFRPGSSLNSTTESKKTMISVRSALPQALVYLMANPDLERPRFGVLTNGDDVVFIKLMAHPTPQYALSRAFSIYTVASELRSAFQVLKRLGEAIA